MIEWLAKEQLSPELAEQVESVRRDQIRICYFSGNGTTIYAGGQTDMDPIELQRKVLEFTVQQYGDLTGIAVVVGKTSGNPAVLPSQYGDDVTFDTIVGIEHQIGYPYSQSEDLEHLFALAHEVPEMQGFGIAPFMKIASSYFNLNIPASEQFTYDTVAMGRLEANSLVDGIGVFTHTVELLGVPFEVRDSGFPMDAINPPG